MAVVIDLVGCETPSERWWSVEISYKHGDMGSRKSVGSSWFRRLEGNWRGELAMRPQGITPYDVQKVLYSSHYRRR